MSYGGIYLITDFTIVGNDIACELLPLFFFEAMEMEYQSREDVRKRVEVGGKEARCRCWREGREGVSEGGSEGVSE